MKRLAAFFRWLGAPVRGARSLFPFTHEGRQTLVYLVFAGSGPALTLLVWWGMRTAFAAGQWNIGGALADKIAWALIIIACALACFVSIRAIKLGPLDVSGYRTDDAAPPAVTTTTTTIVNPAPTEGGH